VTAVSRDPVHAPRPRIELITTGSELLLGQVVNAHIAWIGRELVLLGLTLHRAVTVPDGPAIAEAMTDAMGRAELVIVTGGLGPTSDDVTRSAAAELLGLPLRRDAVIAGEIRLRFASRCLEMPERVLVQADVPEGAEVLPNAHGTAPGLWLRTPRGWMVLLPGPPGEMQPMFTDSVVSRVRAAFPAVPALRVRVLRTLGLGESAAQARLEPELGQQFPGVDIGYCARAGEVDVRLVAERDGDLDGAAAWCGERLAPHVYGAGGDTLESVVIELATARGWQLATAESCTGGLIAHRLTNVPGASAAYAGGMIVYANAEKTRQLGVPAELIAREGAVSSAVAEAMARGAARAAGAQLAVAVTGIAGPGGGTEAKPVGTLWIGVCAGDRVWHEAHRLGGSREAFKHAAAQRALDAMRRAMLPGAES
jgi:nicotinamide-nucleotide amidase